MPFMSPSEQNWLNRGLTQGRAEGRTEGIVTGLTRGIAFGLEVRFGDAGLGLLPRVEAVKDPVSLEAFLQAIKTAPTLDALRELLPSGAPQPT